MKSVYRARRWFQSLSRGLLKPNRLAVVEACLIGLISGLAAVLLKQGAAEVNRWRLANSTPFPHWLWLPLVGLLCCWVAGLLVERIAPEASGSGIPRVKAALSQVPIDMNLRVALVKMGGTILALGSGIPLGRQGPTVQVGAALAGQLSRWVPTSPEHRRQLIAAGAAAGLASGFNAPIAGVLFVIEELLQDLSGLTLGTAIIASFIGAVVSRQLGGQGLNMTASLQAAQASISLQEIPLLLLLGALAGLLGGLFSRGILLSCRFAQTRLNQQPALRMALAGLVCGAVLALLPMDFRDADGLQGLVLNSNLGWQMSAIAFIVKFSLTLLAYGAGIPGGLFAPALLLGSSLGDLLVLTVQGLNAIPGWPAALSVVINSPATYTLAGMGAFFSAVTKGPITAIVIVFEMTNDFNLVLPLMIAAVTAYGVSNRLVRGSVYNHLLAMEGIALDAPAAGQNLWETITAAQVMQPKVETLDVNLPLSQVSQTFQRSHHRGFPVVDREGRLAGIISRSDLTTPANLELPGETPLVELMTAQPVTVPPEAPLATVLYLLNRHKVSRLPVTEGARLVGIITRADIIRAESEHVEGTAAEQQQRLDPSYCVYMTRSPSVGRGRLLLPLANPQTAPTLMQMAAALARQHRYELECVQIIAIPRHRNPVETEVFAEGRRHLLKQAQVVGKEWNVPVHTQIRVGHDVAAVILEVIRDRRIDLTLVGWRGEASGTDRIFNDVLDTLIRQAPCELMMVKLGERLKQANAPYPSLLARLHLNRWLVPASGGENSRKALKRLPGLIALSGTPNIQLCQVSHPNGGALSPQWLEGQARKLEGQVTCGVSTTLVCAAGVVEAIVDLANKEQCDVIVLGASQESLLQQVIKGNMPEAIAHQSRCTVILVRGPLSN